MKCLGYGVYLLLATLTWIAFPPRPASAAEAKVYSLGVIPTWPPVVTHTDWAPFAERLARETGQAFRLKVYENMVDFEREIITPEVPDFIFANALQAVVAHQDQGFLPLVRGGRPVRAELFVRQDSPVTTVADLAGKRIAFVGEKNL